MAAYGSAKFTPESQSDITPELAPRRALLLPLALYGLFFVLSSALLSLLASALTLVLLFTTEEHAIASAAHYILLAGGVALMIGLVLGAVDLFLLLPHKRQRPLVNFDELPNRYLTVVLTAYNDELSIAAAVEDFLRHPLVKRIIVVDNDSKDRTSEAAGKAGAIVVLEKQPGYGQCVYRALQEGARYQDTDLTLLCEGDGTFRAFDIDKFMAYIPHSEIVSGTRIVEQLRDRDTQLTTFMYYGNFAVGKLLEAKYIGQGTFTDVGTTYKLCRNRALARLLPKLNPEINLEFNAHFLDIALRHRISLVECPVTFHKRIGISKGGNINNLRALRVGLRMIRGFLFSWTPAR